MMVGREDKIPNDLFFLCALIEYIGSKTKNHRNVIVNAIGRKGLQHIIEALHAVYNSWLSRKIENFNSSIYYESPQYLLQSYITGDNF